MRVAAFQGPGSGRSQILCWKSVGRPYKPPVAAVYFFVAALIAVSAVADEKPAAPKDEKITFDQHIAPIFREKCGSCHNANDKKGDLVLDNYGLAMQGGASGEVVKTDGDASQSQLYLVVTHQAEPKMPPQQPKLPDDQLTLIRKWIEGGALENAGSKGKAKKNMAVTKVEVSNQRPAGPAPMPESLPLEPIVISNRGNGVTAIASNPWSTLVAVAGHKQIILNDSNTREIVGILPFPEGVAHILKFSRNGQWLLAGGGRGGHSGKVVLWDVKTGKRVAELGAEYDIVLAADISPDHSQVALGGPKKIVRVYDTSTGELLYEKNKHTDWITAIEFSPDGVLLATADRSNGLVVWEAFTGREFYLLTGHTSAITDVSWSPDSNLLGTCSEDTTIRLWEMQNGGQIKNWGAHGGGVTAMEFTRDNRIASTGRDNTAKLWDLNGAAIRVFPGLTDIGMEVAFNSESDFILAGDLNGIVQIWNAKDAAVIGQLNTNPPSLARQIELASQNVSSAETAANQANAAIVGLNKAIADRKAAADAAVKAASDAATAVETTTKTKTASDADVAAKNQVLQAAEAALNDSQTAQSNAVGPLEATNKTIAELLAKNKSAVEAVNSAKADLKQAASAFEAKPDDASLKAASEAASKKLMELQSTRSEINKQLAAASLELMAKAQALAAASQTLNTAIAATEKAAMEKTAADRVAMNATVQLKATSDAAAVAKTEAEKAVAAAVVTPEQQQQLTNLDGAAKTCDQKLATAKSVLERLNAAKGRTIQTTEAAAK